MTTIERLRALAKATETLRCGRDWVSWIRESNVPEAFANETDPLTILALLDVAEAARRTSEMRTKRFAEADITTRRIGEPPPWHLIDESRQANAELDAALARLDGAS